MTKLAPEWVRTSDTVIRRPARYRWTTAPANYRNPNVTDKDAYAIETYHHLRVIYNTIAVPYEYIGGGGGGKGGCENVRPENNFSKNREREITFTEIREREIRR